MNSNSSREPESSAKAASSLEEDQLTVSHRRLLRLTGPIVLSNISVPLLGLADMAIIGRIPNPAALGAVAVCGTIFTFVYWAFGFLRMGTTGLTAQALGAQDEEEVNAQLGRALIVGGVCGLGLILLQYPIAHVSIRLMQASPEVQAMAHDFFAIRIWSAPFTLANFALLGWLIGRQRSDIGLLLQVFMNGLNIVLNVTFVTVLGWSVKGVAAGSSIAEFIACLLGLALAARELRRSGAPVALGRLLDKTQFIRMISVNRDIMLRTLCLIFAFSFFTAQGARSGNITLAANAVLGHFVATAAFLLDSFGYAAEALVGQAFGARAKAMLERTLRLACLWAGSLALLLSVVIYLAGPSVIDLLTVSPEVRIMARAYLPWAAIIPVLAVWCFLLDGAFIGGTRTRDMRNSMAMSLAVFIAAWLLIGPYGNHGLWLALAIFYAARSVTMFVYYPALKAAILSPDR